MGLRGPRPKYLIDTTWRPELAYAVGLIATDGCLSIDGRHIDLTSKDIEQLNNFQKCLGTEHTVSYKSAGNGRVYPRLQFSDSAFYSFLKKIGLTPRKSLTLNSVDIPRQFFFDFLRGHFDGDGCFYSYWDKRWHSSFMYYLTFNSASENHISWLQDLILRSTGAVGKVSWRSRCYGLRYAKRESLLILKQMYYSDKIVYLSRKKAKIDRALAIE